MEYIGSGEGVSIPLRKVSRELNVPSKTCATSSFHPSKEGFKVLSQFRI